MPDDFTRVFESVWIAFRSRWCERTALNGALAFSHDQIKITMFHRVLQVNVDEERVDGMIDDALAFFEEKGYVCAFTLSPLDRPADISRQLQDRGFEYTMQGAAMLCDEVIAPETSAPILVEESVIDDQWINIACNAFDLPPETAPLARSTLDASQIRLYLAAHAGVPAGAALLYSQFDLGYVDLVGTLPEHRRKGIASALVARAVADSQAMGNRWTALEVASKSPAERIYTRLGFRTKYYRPRYMPVGSK